MRTEKLKLGEAAPDFELADEAGRFVKLSDYRGRKVVLYFYPEDDTPGCTKQACGFRDSYGALTASGSVVLGVSPDGGESHGAFKNKYRLPFPLLVDEDHDVATRYGVWVEKTIEGEKSMGMLRSHFVIGEDGRIADIQVGVTAEESVTRALQTLGADRGAVT